jgi:TolB-like protein/tetratricopeptide (TPR) repeat protein
MPFENRSADEDAEYLCDGMAERLIATLSRLSGLRVLSRHATFGLRDEVKDVRALGERLQVDALLLGDLKSRGDQLMVNVELVGVSDGRCLWGERYDRPLVEAGAVEQDVVESVARQLETALSGVDQEPLPARSVDPQAYLLYLKGRSLIIGSRTQMIRGAEYLEAAARKDPDYALPHAALVESYMTQAFHNILGIAEARQKARASARQAVRLEPESPEANMALGVVRFMFDWDWEGADEAFRRSIELGPGNDVAHLEYAEYLSAMGRMPEALRMAVRARELDPVSPNPTHTAAYILMLMGDYEGAIREFKTAISLHPNWIWGHIKLAGSYSRMGKHDLALKEVAIAEAALHGGGTPLARSWLGRVYAAAGRRDRALEIQAELRDVGGIPIDPLVRGYIPAAFGEGETVLECIEQAYAERSALCALLPQYAKLEPQLHLEAEPRFRKVIRKMQFPEWLLG